ncbi:MAG TPA: glycoside hydrolase family 30 protein [Vicinamibacteria bacterium]|nr:glycoside hydrolase family 30 protein [Vicinamibacteria bacterium]
MQTNRWPVVIALTALDAVCLSVTAHAQGPTYLEARVYVTAPSPLQLLADRGFSAFEPLDQPDENYPTIIVDPARSFQTIEGFGGAFTDAAADVFTALPAAAQEAFLKASFDPVEGNGYTLCRTTIHSCDYAADMYTYDEVPGDTTLAHFSIEHDRRNRLPFIKRAQTVSGGRLRLYASPWSPPAWMKTNGEMLHGGKLKPEYRQTWADYFVRYVKAYAAEGVPIWGLTVQNEPLATQVWESCLFTANEERDFVRDYLGPTLHKGGLGDLKLMIWDHNRGLIYQRAEAAYSDPAASKYIWGTAFHWYVGDHHDNVRQLHDAFPDKALFYTEGGLGGSWEEASRLAQSVIRDLNNWTAGWTVWNLLVDSEGGPRHAGGLMGSSSVNADLRTGQLTFNPPHYAFGHFTRFIRPGARRVACTSSSDDFLATAFRNPDGKIAVVLTNLTDHEQIFQVWVKGRALRSSSPARGILTIVL